jgi:hypothetical protein
MDWGMEKTFGSFKEQARPGKGKAIWFTFIWMKKQIV